MQDSPACIVERMLHCLLINRKPLVSCLHAVIVAACM